MVFANTRRPTREAKLPILGPPGFWVSAFAKSNDCAQPEPRKVPTVWYTASVAGPAAVGSRNTTKRYLLEYGKPVAFYSDKHTHFGSIRRARRVAKALRSSDGRFMTSTSRVAPGNLTVHRF